MDLDLEALDRAIPTPRALARTYRHRSYDDPWGVVVDYRRVMDARERDPDAGSAALATRLDLPRSRIRPWVDDGARPAPVAAIHTAAGRGWFVDDISLAATEGTALATLVAWVFAGGSITREFVPRFVLRSSDRYESLARLANAAEYLGIDLTERVRDETRANEYVPATDASVLGRVLHAAGAPVGPKGAQELALPAWIVDGPMNVKRAAAVTYLGERMVPAGVSRVFQHRWASASDAFLGQVGALLVEVCGGSYVVKHEHLRLDVEATRAAERLLGEYTEWP